MRAKLFELIARPRVIRIVKKENAVAADRGFTLVELLVVIAIIAILASMLLPVLGRAKEDSVKMKCVNNAKQLGMALQMYGDDNGSLLPMPHGTEVWNAVNPQPWTQVFVAYYNNTNILTCPSYCQFYSKSPYNYFMGAREAYVQNGDSASVDMRKILLPSQYVLSGDCNFAFETIDADPDNYTQDTLFANLPPQGHNGWVNVLFGDEHVRNYNKFNPNEITFSYTQPGIPWLNVTN